MDEIKEIEETTPQTPNDEEKTEYNSNIPVPTVFYKSVNNDDYYPPYRTSEPEKNEHYEPEKKMHEEKGDENSVTPFKSEKATSGEIISLVLAIYSVLFLAIMPIIGTVLSLVCSISGIVCSAVSIKKRKHSFSSAGIIISIISMILSILAIILLAVFGSAIINAIIYLMQDSSRYYSGFNSPFFMFP